MAKNLTVAIGVKPGGPPPLKRLGEPDKPPMDMEPDPGDPNEAAEGEGADDWDEWLEYHDPQSDGTCRGCQFMGDDGSCPKVQHTVNPDAWCNAFTAKDEQQDQQMPGQNDMGPQEQEQDYQQ